MAGASASRLRFPPPRARSIADASMASASRATDFALLWWGLALALASLGGPSGRGAAKRGLLAMGFASATVNGPLKLLVRRPRPSRRRLPRGLRMPRSYSFPSGHAASAFAFTTAVSRELPSIGPFLIPLASLVAYSRVYLGVHHPSDVVAGAAIGVGSGVVASSLHHRAEHAGAACVKWI